MAWEVEVTDEFEEWFTADLDGAERTSIAAGVDLLEELGPALPFPYSSGVFGLADCPPSAMMRSANSACARSDRIAADQRSIASRGVPAGANTPLHKAT